MSEHLHLDLLKDEERFSSSPVRLRVLVPILAISAAVGSLLWCAYLSLGQRNLSVMKARLQANTDGLKSSHENFLTLVQEEREASAVIHQLRYYEHARIRAGAVLTKLPALVPASIQLAEIRIQTATPAGADPKNAENSVTNLSEAVVMKIAGRAFGESASAQVDALLAALRRPEFASVFPLVEIPKGTFRQDFSSLADNRVAFLFELSCSFAPRRFE
jgi:Tfp pilus assembly protein PilN